MRLRKKLCAIGLSCMLGVLCYVSASAAENTVNGGEMCGVCGWGNFVETFKEVRRQERVKCSGCKRESIVIHYYERIHYFQCDYPYCGYMNDYSIPEYIEYADSCPYCCILFP